MSFGFSIGDIVLLSQLTFKLYSTVTSGRKAASRDLKELEDVLFSLKCALDHLGEVAKDISAQANSAQAGSKFKGNLDRMIAACGSTLQELDTVTKSYRELGIDDEAKLIDEKAPGKRRTLEDVKKGIKVNWKKIRWDQEKQSLQQYREKLKSHCDAVNLILTSTIWANTTQAEAKSKTSHDKTHELLEDVLKSSQNKVPFQKMITEIHSAIIATGQGGSGTRQIPTLGLAHASHSSLHMNQKRMNASQLSDMHPQKPIFAYSANTAFVLPSRPIKQELPSSTMALNNERKAFAAKEYAAFIARYPTQSTITPTPVVPSLSIPTLEQLRLSIPTMFQPLLSGKLETQQRSRDINCWIECFSALVHQQKSQTEQKETNEAFLQLLIKLNEHLEKSEMKMKQLFFDISNKVGLQSALDELLKTTKSVRLMKEVEEFEDMREDLEESIDS